MEEWSQWHPVVGLSGRFFIQDLRMSGEGLVIHLSAQDNEKKIEILFGGDIHAYRCINESWCFNIFGELNNKYGGSFYRNWSFFKITNSNYVKSLAPLNAGVSNDVPFDHFCIVENDLVLDVLTLDEPRVNIISFG